MKAGGCKESFVAWENCVDEAKKNDDYIAAKCMAVTAALRRCMEDHADYYEPILRAEKAAHEEAIRELEKEKAAKEESERNSGCMKDLEKKMRWLLLLFYSLPGILNFKCF
ncbi:EXS (ERD1/XPR1/SYG1) family protein [Hibiscus syriacus]|uniref:EXS (ERD1/XPR1/SYG1) family protein n=2 Tax=Hibiscus syriacus TaxID=106335 RepID=A0A6A2YU99_HIBSY|nr:EXS (ERD1/XPR1/SYG1) family protein [Hibiscus syriacus]